MLNALTPSRYTVHLRSVGNPDYGQYAPVSNPETVTVETVREAIQACRRYIEEWDLGGGNWPWVALYCIASGKKKRVGYVSYNGRLWAGKNPSVEIPVI